MKYPKALQGHVVRGRQRYCPVPERLGGEPPMTLAQDRSTETPRMVTPTRYERGRRNKTRSAS